MTDATVRLRQADEGDLSYVERRLAENGLPSRDVRSKPGCFYVADDGDGPVGVGGIETRGADGLLRSLVVERSARGDGIGTAICEALEAEARDRGVERLYLLTTTAAEFFAARGYEPVERSAVPRAIRDTAQFADLCPASATCMRTSL